MKYLSLVKAPEVLDDPKKVVEIIREHVEIINSLKQLYGNPPERGDEGGR